MNSGDDASRVALEEEIKNLKAALRQNDNALLVTFRLTPKLTNLLGLLIATDLVTQDMIQDRLRIATEAKVAIHRLRTALLPWAIRILSRRNTGWWLDKASKQRIEELLSPQFVPLPPAVATELAAA